MGVFIKNVFDDIQYAYIVLTIFLLVIFGVYLVGMPQISVNFVFLFLFIALFCFKKYDLILFLFIALFPTNGFADTKYNILGIVNSKYIVSLFALFSAILKEGQIKSNYNFDKLTKYAFYLIVFIAVYLFLQNFKVDQLGIQQFAVTTHLTIFIKLAIDVIVFYYIIKFSNIPYYKLYFQKAFFYSLLIISLSMIFVDTLYEIGIYMGDEDSIKVGDANKRVLGVWGLICGGDENSLGGYLVMGLSCILFSAKKKPWLLVTIIILGLMHTGSRTGFFNLVIVVLAFMLCSQDSILIKLRNILLVSLLAFILFKVGVFDFVIERTMKLVTGEDEGLDANGLGRLSGWFFYLNYIMSDMRYFFFGVTENIYDAVSTEFFRNRVAHNFYIQLWYYFGVFALCIFLYLLTKICVCILKSKNKIQFFLILPACITLFTVSDIGVGFYIPIVLVLFTNNEFNYKVQKYVKKE